MRVHLLSAAVFFAALFSFEARASNCVIADHTDTSLNVRESPNGNVINRLRNGRTISIDRILNDSKGRPWGYATGLYKGKDRKWGWVFMESVDCSGNGARTEAKARLSLRMPTNPYGCVVTEKGDSALNVRDRPNGKVVNRLSNGKRIDIRKIGSDAKGRPWGYATGKHRGIDREWGWVFMQSVDCSERARSAAVQNYEREKNSDYPIFIDGSVNLKPFGLHSPDYDRPETRSSAFGNKCSAAGDGAHTLSLSPQTVRKFKNRGFTIAQMCMALRIGDLRYDPETGKRLPTYIIGDRIEVARAAAHGQHFGAGVMSEEFPFTIPPCFRNSRISYAPIGETIKTNCDFKFNPRTGKRFSAAERRDWKQEKYNFFISGDAGPSGGIVSAKLLIKSKQRNTKADVKSVLRGQ